MTSDPNVELLAEINTEQLALIDQLDARQDQVLKELDELTHRIEQIIELYVNNRHVDQQQKSAA